MCPCVSVCSEWGRFARLEYDRMAAEAEATDDGAGDDLSAALVGTRYIN